MAARQYVVAHYVPTYFEISENWIRTQVVCLPSYQSIVLTGRVVNPELTSNGCPVVSLEERSMVSRSVERLTGRIPLFRRALREHKAAIVHAHFGPGGVRMKRVAESAGLPLVTTFYGYDVSRLPQKDPSWRKRYAELFRFGSAFLVEGPYMASQLKRLGCPADKIQVHHLGIRIEEVARRSGRSGPEKGLRVLSAGRFVEKKGFEYGIRAFSSFLRMGGKGTLTVVGDASKYPESQATKQRIVDLVRSERLEAHVRFVGMITPEALRRLYSIHDVFLAPSVQAADGDNEGGAPVTVIEASAAGIPVIGTRHCDIPEVVIDGTTGALAGERDIEGLTRALLMYAAEPSVLRKHGQNARGHVLAEFDAARQGRQLERVYQSCLESHGRDSDTSASATGT